MESPEVAAADGGVPNIAEWRKIASPLRDYESKKAGNSVSVLENFLLNELPAITLENCLKELDKIRAGGSSSDFFSDKRRHIETRLGDQCKALAVSKVRSEYGDLRRTFNRELAGKFPFVKVEPGVRVEDAQPEAVRSFINRAGEFIDRYRGQLIDRYRDPNGKKKKDASTLSEVVRFLEKVDAARTFLKPLWAQADSAEDGVYDVRVEFRVNQAIEVGGNRIAEWSIRLANERLFLGGPKPEAPWRVGDPVYLDLRWAKNSLDVPAPVQGSGVTVEGRTVTFQEGGLWALLRLIAFHQTAASQNAADKGDIASHVLAFVVQTTPDPTGGFFDRVGTDSPTVRVYIRAGVMGIEKDKLLKYPEFPTTAPVLPSAMTF
jgi:type VI secretion system protein ImpL